MENQQSGQQTAQVSIQSSQPVTEHKNSRVLVFIIVILIGLLIVGVTGTYVWQHNKVSKLNSSLASSASSKSITSINSTANSSPSTTKTWTYSRTYSISYPSNWTVGETTGDDTSPNQASGPFITFSPKGLPSQALPISVTVFNTADINSVMSNNAVPSNATNSPKSLTINGYPALYYQEVVPTTSVSGSLGFTDDFYAVTNSSTNTTLLIEFQESQKGALGETYNATSFVPAYNAFVKSVQFLKDEE
jgi:hypothetical protein